MNQGIFFGQMVIGPAGSGKSTYCKVMQEMAETLKRNIIVFNLDPAAEYSEYRCHVDIKDLITLEDVMEEMELGPNGALLFCMQYLVQNQGWLHDKLNEFVGQDDFVIFDCPGQIELYNDQDVFRQIVKLLQNYGFSLVSMYMMDINFISDNNKFLSGIMQALSAQIALELPSITVLTKCDLIQEPAKIDTFLTSFSSESEDSFAIDLQERESKPPEARQKTKEAGYKAKEGEQKGVKESKLWSEMRKILNSNDQISIRQLNLNEDDSIRNLLLEADTAIQYGENLEPDDKAFDQAEQHLTSQAGNFQDYP